MHIRMYTLTLLFLASFTGLIQCSDQPQAKANPTMKAMKKLNLGRNGSEVMIVCVMLP